MGLVSDQDQQNIGPGPEVIKLFSCSTQMTVPLNTAYILATSADPDAVPRSVASHCWPV